jgi:hypothetical protein
MAQSSGDYQAVTMMASSQYHSVGTLHSLINSAEQRNIKTYRFDLFDIMSSCGHKYPQECGECPLFEWTNPYTGNHEEMCTGRGAIADGHYSYRDALKKFYEIIDPERFALQYLLLTGAQQGMVYPQYEGYAQRSFSGHTEKELELWSAYAGIDMRGRGRIVAIIESPEVNANGKHERWAIAEWADDNSTPSKLISACKQMKADILHEFGIPITTFWAERAAGDLIKDFPTDLNAKIIEKEVSNVAYGVGLVRDGFFDNMGLTSLYVDPTRCPKLDEAIASRYKCKRTANGEFDRDSFSKDGEDFADALRYAFVGGPQRSQHIPAQDVTDMETRMRVMQASLSRMQTRLGSGRWTPY